MEDQSTLGGLMPLLILGAPLVASVFDLLKTPKHGRSTSRDAWARRPRTEATVGTVSGRS